jgi:SAM-dependent methyltransferase
MSTYSILRTKEDAEVAKLTLTGRVIDLGGHKGSSYFTVLTSVQPIEVANFDSEQTGTHKTPSQADHVFDFEKPFPLSDDMFGHVLCINVMEHIYNYQNLVHESFRILKSGGTMYLSVPFFFNIHGSPNDYFRFTKPALERIFTDAGFEQITITELGEGPCSVVFQTFGGSIPTMALKLFFKTIAMKTDTFLSKLSRRYALIRYRVPLGYFVSAHKK